MAITSEGLVTSYLKGKVELIVIYKACSNRNWPDAKPAFKKQTKISTKCGCGASFNFNSFARADE
jgi:hypothetical protein